ncbi:MAG: peptidase S8, partial [Okeania sp. SIO3B3]|nr:peptidase S8 [Okeania sp. SIO3B3]
LITDSTNFSTIDEAITRNLTAGTYIVEVESIDDANTGYNLQLSATPRPDLAGNTLDTSRQVGALVGTQTFNDWVGNIDSSDYYQFTLDSKRTVDIDISGLSDVTSLYLYNSSGDTFSYDANGNYQGSSYIWRITGETGSMSRVLNPGTYFVRVSDYNTSSGLGTNYNLNLSAS